MSTLTNGLPEGLLRAAVAAHAVPRRAYHSWAHVQEVLRHLETVPAWHRRDEVVLAAIFHDAVYVAGRSDNEARSADLARDAIGTFLVAHQPDVAFVCRLIELTRLHGKHRREDLDDDTRHFLDADMAILGSAPEVFDAYDAAIAEEYAHVPRLLYRFNRRRFLARLLDSDRIFLSDFFHARLDAPARANLRRALAD